MSAASSIKIPGPVAEDKDLARELRVKVLLPALAEGRYVVVDFRAVATATQSFLHACLSEAIRKYGEEVLESIEFRGCGEDIRQLIGTVVEYSLRARTLTQAGLSGKLKKSDVPQADNLQLVRAVLDALASGRAAPEDIAVATKFSFRHVHYRLHAARVLGFVRLGRNIASLTASGRRLVAAEPDSAEERQLIVDAVRSSVALQKVCPTLLEKKPPTRAELTRRIEQKTGLSRATASRRAAALLSWRRILMNGQPTLPGLSPGGETSSTRARSSKLAE